MKVLQIGKYYPPVEGGIENNVHAVSVGLSSRYDVTALVFNTRRGTVDEVREGVRVVRVSTLGKILSTEIAPAFLPWFLRLRDADVIHLHTPNPVGELACLAAPRRTRLVITYHSDVVKQKLLGRLNRVLLRFLMRRADRIIAYTRRYMETSPVIGAFADKCAIIPHGVDLAEFATTPQIEAKAAKLRREHGPRIVLFVGRLVYYKGVDTLLRALQKVPDAKLLVVGDGPMKPSLLQLAAELGVESRVTFFGRMNHADKVACYQACDFLVLPATHRSEAFGQVQVEALACGKPVICADIDSGVPFVNQHGITGLVVRPADPESLASAMRQLCTDAELRARFGAAGRQRASEVFSREVMVRDSLALYDEVLGAAAGQPVAAGGRAT